MTILIADENDNAPLIDIYPYDISSHPNPITIYLNESLAVNSLVLSLSIIDRDSGDNGRVAWKLNRLSPIPFELVRLTESTGELRTKHLLDREQTAEYKLVLEASDHGRPTSRVTRLNLSIVVLDENDNVPKFQPMNMNATISEHVKVNHTTGYDVFHLHADDADQGPNGEIVYSIFNNDDRVFRIDPTTGIIRAMVEFDRQRQDTYVLQVEARDKGTPPWSSRGTVTFKIVTRNEHSPVCENAYERTAWSIVENSAYGTILGTIRCYDEDREKPNGQMTVYPYWFPDEPSADDRLKSAIPFEVLTEKSNTSQVRVGQRHFLELR